MYRLSAVTGVSFFLRVCPNKFFHSSVQYHNFFTVVSQHVFYVSVPARFLQLCTSMFFMGVFHAPCFLWVCSNFHALRFLRVSHHVFYGCVPCTTFFSGVPTCFFSAVPACFLLVCFMHHVFLRVSQHVFFGCHGMFFYVYVPDFQHFLCECIPALFLIIKLTSFGGKRKKFTNLPPKNF